jgi:hypothetical protein
MNRLWGPKPLADWDEQPFGSDETPACPDERAADGRGAEILESGARDAGGRERLTSADETPVSYV